MSVTVVKISQKLWSRIKESRWTILYISFAICQMIISIIIEAVILRQNEGAAIHLSDLNGQNNTNPQLPPSFSYMNNFTYLNYLAQYNSIVDGNIWFMVFEAFLTALCVSSLYFQNTIEIMSIGIINICLLLFSCIQVFQSFKWIRRINIQIQLDFPENFTTLQLSQTVIYAELVQLAFLTFFAAASIFLGYKLYGQFGWKIYKKIGADIHTQSMYRTYLIFLLLMKLDVFLLLGFQILNLVFLFGDSIHYTHTIIFQGVCIAIVIPTLGLGLWGVRSENRPAMFIYAILSIATIINFLYILATFIIYRDESLLTFLDILGIALIVLTLFIACLAYNNFDHGLKDHFQRRYEGVGNPEDKYRRFPIDEDI